MIIRLVKHIFFHEDEGRNHTGNHSDQGWKPPLREWKSGNIHSIETEDDIWDGHNDGNDSQYLHDDV